MAINYTQTDGSGCAISGGVGRRATLGGTPGSTEISQNVSGSAVNAILAGVDLQPAANVSWDGGNLTARLNITSSNMNITWNRLRVYRLNSSCTIQETIATFTGLGISLGSTGVKSTIQTIPSITPSASDRLQLEYSFDNGSSMIQSFGWTPSPNIDTPFNEIAAPTGTIAQTTAKLQQAISGSSILDVTGTVAQTLAKLTQELSVTSIENITGTINQIFAKLQQSVSGAEIISGTIAQSFAKLEQAIIAKEIFIGIIAQIFPKLQQSASGVEIITGAISNILPKLQQEASGLSIINVTGTIDQILPKLQQELTAKEIISGVIVQILPSTAQDIVGNLQTSSQGTIAQTTPKLQQELTGIGGEVTIVLGFYPRRRRR